jgi:hypothetical protein
VNDQIWPKISWCHNPNELIELIRSRKAIKVRAQVKTISWLVAFIVKTYVARNCKKFHQISLSYTEASQNERWMDCDIYNSSYSNVELGTTWILCDERKSCQFSDIRYWYQPRSPRVSQDIELENAKSGQQKYDEIFCVVDKVIRHDLKFILVHSVIEIWRNFCSNYLMS